MTLQEIKLLHAFNSWATNRILNAVAEMPPELYTKDMKSSHGSIHGTLVHMVSAEKIWCARMAGEQEAKVTTTADVATLDDLRHAWEQVGFAMAKLLGSMTDKKLQATFTAPSPRGQTFTHTYWQVIQHVVDHSTYHRGQVITLMRQNGVVPPNTGLIAFYREIGSQRIA
jgi:uncharacterized damage-inducible protein DinB